MISKSRDNNSKQSFPFLENRIKCSIEEREKKSLSCKRRVFEIFLATANCAREGSFRNGLKAHTSRHGTGSVVAESRTDRRCQLTRSWLRCGRIVGEIIARAVDEIVPFTPPCRAPTRRARDRGPPSPLTRGSPPLSEISKLLWRWSPTCSWKNAFRISTTNPPDRRIIIKERRLM